MINMEKSEELKNILKKRFSPSENSKKLKNVFKNHYAGIGTDHFWSGLLN